MAADRRNLPVLKTIVQGYGEALPHFPDYAIQALIWAGVVGAVHYLLGQIEAPMKRAAETAEYWSVATHYAVLFAKDFVLLLGGATTALAAYRAAIQNQRPAWQRALLIGRRDLRFIGLTLVLYIVGYGELILLAGILHMSGALSGVVAVMAWAGAGLVSLVFAVVGNLLVAATLTTFFGLAFPLASIGAPGGVIRRALRISRGYRGRLGVISFLAELPFLVAAYLPFLLWTTNAGTIGENAQMAAYALIAFLGVAFATSAFAVAFITVVDHHNEAVSDVFD